MNASSQMPAVRTSPERAGYRPILLSPTFGSRYSEPAGPMHEIWFHPSRRNLFLAGVVMIVIHAGAAAQGPSPGTLTLSVPEAPGPLKPGGVALVSVVSTQDLTELKGEA